MPDTRKIALMTKAALCEQKGYKQSLRIIRLQDLLLCYYLSMVWYVRLTWCRPFIYMEGDMIRLRS